MGALLGRSMVTAARRLIAGRWRAVASRSRGPQQGSTPHEQPLRQTASSDTQPALTWTSDSLTRPPASPVEPEFTRSEWLTPVGSFSSCICRSWRDAAAHSLLPPTARRHKGSLQLVRS
ncbi:hypothetical protein TgHK011_003655 [Trichoderma gracile]|nr:hypothetical protein TgHK011_003655 [Trichoderma gracile]